MPGVEVEKIIPAGKMKYMIIALSLATGIAGALVTFDDYVPATHSYVKVVEQRIVQSMQRDLVSNKILALDTQYIVIKQTLSTLKAQKADSELALKQATDVQMQNLLRDKINRLEDSIDEASRDQLKNTTARQAMEPMR